MVETLRPGDHVCWTVGTDDEQLQVTSRYISDGLARHHRIVYFTHSLMPQAVSAGLEARGVPVAAAVEAGQLRITSSARGYLASGRFDAAAMPAAWAAEQDATRAAGWTGLRAIGDMAWAASRLPGAEDLASYEARVNRVFAEGYAMALCLYDRRLFTAAELAPIISAHPCAKGAADGDLWEPALRMRYTTAPYRLTLRGEIDAANRDAVAAMLATLAEESTAAGRTGEVDLSGVAVYDVSTATRLVRAADAGSIRLTGESPQLTKLIRLLG
ncbi:MEDS domain-containing protein [Catenuloplanes japonicus]|uniref:MEDS domain-containing protein n=1 Tax=Catenuloplanes japonicus TaxID=33876 RepID=UPI00068D2267|nr:MEDS domain-containing protein [Catenuloplanes japonicus]